MKKKFAHIIRSVKALLLLSILLCIAQVDQAQLLTDLQSNFNNTRKAALQEKLYVHISKNTFLTGETIWFKIYSTDGSTNKPSTISKVVYVEVLDHTQTAVLQAKIAMINGTGDGSFQLPATLGTGNYRLRAYTNWMKNFDPDRYFSQTISIINPQKEIAQKEDKTVSYDVQFFPEGGHWVAGSPSKVAFKVSASNGSTVNAAGAILDNRNDTVARFKTLKFGIGSFVFAPKVQTTYRAVVNINGKPLPAELPVISTAGYVMQANDNGNNIDVTVTSAGIKAQNVYLLVHTTNAIEIAQSASIANGNAHFSIDRHKLNEGVSYITLFDEQKQPIAERLIFIRPERKLNISANADTSQYATRKKVSINIGTQNQRAKNVSANLSMTVYRVDSLQQISSANIAAYLWLSAAVKGHIESPDYYFDNNTAESNQALDNLLLSQGWTQFDWTNILANKTPTYNYLPEFIGPIVTANVINTITNQSAAGIYGYLTIPGKFHQFYVSKSDSTGKLIFNTRGSVGSKDIILKTDTRHDSTYRIDLVRPFSEQYSNEVAPEFNIAPGLFSSLTDNNINAQINYIFNRDEVETIKPDTSYFYKKAPYTYNLDDYTRFKTLAEVIHEYVRFVSVTYESGQPHLRMSYNRALLPNETIALVDAEPIFNAGDIYKLDPLKLKRIDVINNKYIYGPQVFDGFISLTTYNGDRGNVILDSKAVTIDYEGLQAKRKFYSPVYDTDMQQKNTLPDFRTTLFWSPNINSSEQGTAKATFYTGDKTGKYIGVIEGLSPNGEAGSKQFYFEVKK